MRWLSVILYAAIGFATFGIVFNDRPCGTVTRTYTDAVGGKQVFTETRSCVSPIASGAFWPAYWLGVAAIAITKPGETDVQKSVRLLDELIDTVGGIRDRVVHPLPGPSPPKSRPE